MFYVAICSYILSVHRTNFLQQITKAILFFGPIGQTIFIAFAAIRQMSMYKDTICIWYLETIDAYKT